MYGNHINVSVSVVPRSRKLESSKATNESVTDASYFDIC